MGIEGHSLDKILGSIKPREVKELIIDGLVCRVFKTTPNTWNVYVADFPFSVTLLTDSKLVANDASQHPLPEHASVKYKELAIKAVSESLTEESKA